MLHTCPFGTVKLREPKDKLVSQLITKVLVEQPLALPGSANDFVNALQLMFRENNRGIKATCKCTRYYRRININNIERRRKEKKK